MRRKSSLVLICLVGIFGTASAATKIHKFHPRPVSEDVWPSLVYASVAGVATPLRCGTVCAKGGSDCGGAIHRSDSSQCLLMSTDGNHADVGSLPMGAGPWAQEAAFVRVADADTCQPAPTLHSTSSGAHSVPSTIFDLTDCEVIDAEGSFNWFTAYPPGPVYFVVDLGCDVTVTSFTLRATKHHVWGDFLTKDFSIEVSHSPDSGWQLVFEDVLMDPRSLDSCDIPYQTFEHLAQGRYVRLAHKTSYSYGFGFKYIGFEFFP